jgi:hypothetical protein
MKKIIGLFCIALLIIGCNKRNNNQIIEIMEDNLNLHILEEKQTENDIRIMFVNSYEGLRVRNLPSIDGERIGLLENLTKVVVIKEDNNIVNIDGIDGKWTFIDADSIQGWVFGAYLSQKARVQGTQALDSIREIGENIFYNNNFTVKSYNSLDEVSKLFNSFRIINEYGNFYIIEADHYILSANTEYYNKNNWWVRIDEIFLDETNYLHMFPYRTIVDYLADDKFGFVEKITENEIFYSDMLPSTISLRFQNGLLHSIRMYWFFL